MHSANRLPSLSSISPTSRDGAGIEERWGGRGGYFQTASLLAGIVFFFFLVFQEILLSWQRGRWCSGGVRILFVQAHGRALVHAHVGITQQASRLTLDAFRIQGM